MGKFKDLKIAAKLILSFILVALIAGVVGAVGVYFIRTINASDEKLYSNNTMGINNVANADIYFQRVRYNMVKILLDPSTMEERADGIEEYKTEIENYLEKYKSTIISDEDQDLYNIVEKNWGVYKSTFEQVMDMIVNNKIEDAKTLAGGEAQEYSDALNASFEELIKFNIESAKERSEGNTTLAERALMMMVLIIIIGVLFAVTLGIFISRIIGTPVNRMVEAAKQLTLGDVDVNIDVSSKDEIGNLAEALKAMIENVRMQAKIAEKIADGDLTVDAVVRSEKDLLGRKLHELVSKNNEVLKNITAASEQVASGSKQVSASSIALSQGATEQASAIEQLTSSLEEISSQTKLNAKNASQANELAEIAKNNAIQGNSQMKEMQTAMDEINISSTNISKIIKVIDEIAFQTNILALNAAVEAARAGQHGKGFAVVAEEVRNLAARSANAAKETTDMIEGSINKVEAGTKIANDTAQALNKIVEDVAKAANLVADIAEASNEQATGIAQINQGIMQVSQVVQTNSATAEESAAASEELSSQAMLLKESVSKYKLKADRYSSGKFDELNPDVIKMLDNMSDRKEKNFVGGKQKEVSTGKAKIALSDEEFGKY